MFEHLKFNDEYENKIYLPNEIFDELGNADIKSSHIAFSYSFIYLMHWLYRYVKYTNVSVRLDTKVIKQLLGYHGDFDGVTYLIKENGILEKMNWIETSKNIPLSVSFEESVIKFNSCFDDNGFMKYVYGKEDSNLGYSPNFKIKLPIRGLYRQLEDSEYYTGTFYNIENTHLVTFDIFRYCMETEVGCTGFYLYGYLRYKNQIFKNGYDCSIEKLIEYTRIPHRTLMRNLDILKKYKMINCVNNQEFYVFDMTADRKSNTYHTNNFDEFSFSPVEYNKIKIR